MLLAFMHSRTTDPGCARPYRVPGGDAIAKALAVLCIVVLALSIFLFLYTPGEGVQWPVLYGALVMIVLGELVIRWAEYARKRE